MSIETIFDQARRMYWPHRLHRPEDLSWTIHPSVIYELEVMPMSSCYYSEFTPEGPPKRMLLGFPVAVDGRLPEGTIQLLVEGCITEEENTRNIR